MRARSGEGCRTRRSRTARRSHWSGGMRPLGGPITEMRATLEALGDDMPSYVLYGENRGAGMIVTFTRGTGAVFNGGSTDWPCAPSSGHPFVAQVAHSVLRRFLG